MENRSALIAGASGLVGSQLLNILLNSSFYYQVYVLSRRPLKIRHPKLEELIIDFDELPKMTAFPQVQDVYCCLGTTMKKAGSKEAFRKVDYRYPLELAKKAAEKGATQYLLMRLLGPFLIGPLRKYRGIHARTVAKGMYHVARQDLRGVDIYESEEIKPLAAEISLSQNL